MPPIAGKVNIVADILSRIPLSVNDMTASEDLNESSGFVHYWVHAVKQGIDYEAVATVQKQDH